MWKVVAKKTGGKIVGALSLPPSELSKPEAYIDHIKREFQLPEYADAFVRYYSNPAYWKKLYGDDPLNSPNRPVPQDALPPPKGASYLGAASSSDPMYRGFSLLPDFHRQLQMPSPVDSFGTRFGKWNSIANPPASFDDRFGNWVSVPAAGSGDTRSPVLRALEKYRRSEAPGGPVMALAQGTFPEPSRFSPILSGRAACLASQWRTV